MKMIEVVVLMIMLKWRPYIVWRDAGDVNGKPNSSDGCGVSFSNEGVSFADEGVSFADEGVSFADEGVSFADENVSFVDKVVSVDGVMLGLAMRKKTVAT